MEDFESLLSFAEHLPEMPGHNSLPVTESLRGMRIRLAVEKAIHDNPGDEPTQIDAIATARCYFMGCGRAVDIVNSYVNGTIDVLETVRRIAEPIEHAYITADGGRRFVSEELCARSQRSYHEPEMALELWGPEEDLDELQARVTDPDGAPTVEANCGICTTPSSTPQGRLPGTMRAPSRSSWILSWRSRRGRILNFPPT